MHCPHLIWDSLLKSELVQIENSLINSSWDWFRNLNVEWAVNHVASRDHVPLTIYGDSAQYTKFGDSITGICMSCPLFDTGPVSQTRHNLCQKRNDL
jgi:hypothetical protein